jgi:hypothetical protein
VSRRETRVRVSVLLSICAIAAAMLALPTVAAAGVDSRGNCIGLDCAGTSGAPDVPEARRAVPAVADVDELLGRESGFYDIPAPLYQGDIQPRAVVYYSDAGELGSMPASVRGLRAVRDVENAARPKLNSEPVVVVGPGAMLLGNRKATSARRGKARAAHGDDIEGCPTMYFCVWAEEGFGGPWDPLYGPTYVSDGWWNWGSWFNNTAESMVNHRDNGDSLLANGANGTGARYCARQHSEDSTFSNNSFMNVASSFALLGSGVDRC